MCTAVCYRRETPYFGRNLDLDHNYEESVVITPRNYKIDLRFSSPIISHYAMIGMATVSNGFPLYYDATNEKGVSIAGLNFPKNAVYNSYTEDRYNVASFELIPWILAQCSSIDEAERLLSKTNVTNTKFNDRLPLTPLHWLISDRERSIALEPLACGLKIYENPFEVLTNNPPFDYHMINASNYMDLGTGSATSRFNADIPLKNYSLGMGALGLPGDFSSASRFIRAFFVKENSVSEPNEQSNVNQFFHILNSVSMPNGCVKTERGFEYTLYSSCCNTDKIIYYYKTYNDQKIRSVKLCDVDLDQSKLYTYEVAGL